MILSEYINIHKKDVMLKDVAKYLEIDIVTLSRYIHGRRAPTGAVAERIIRKTGGTITWEELTRLTLIRERINK